MTFIYNNDRRIESVQLVEGKLEVVVREPSNTVLMSNPPKLAPDKIYKEIYGVSDGKIVLEKTILGKHTPARVVEEAFIFNTENTIKEENRTTMNFGLVRGLAWTKEGNLVSKDGDVYG